MPHLSPVGIVVPGGGGHITLQAEDEDGRMICGVYHLEGKLNLPPKAWLGRIRAEMRRLENIARAAGCVEMRMGGRDWSRVFPDYEPIQGPTPNLLRKVL